MDQMTFHYDTVLSDVHMHRPSSRHLMTRLNHMGQPGTRSSPVQHEDRPGGSKPLWLYLFCVSICLPFFVIVSVFIHFPEFNCFLLEIHSENHTMATPLEDVGKQVWRGAFLLADFILSEPQSFRGATVLELGGGTGFTSVVMATVAKTVYCTDVGDDLLSMCERNVALNRHLLEPKGGEVRVRRLDWLQHHLCTDADTEFSWSEEEVSDLHDNTTFIIAADVCYDDDLTDAFFRTLYKLCSNFSRPCAVLISIEKRMNFTLRHLDVTCEAYSHFRACLEQLQALQDGRCSFRVEPLTSNFPQFLLYERIEHLELWKVTSTPLPAGLQEDSGS
uniref:Methyltransferase like 22 n=1 Tax=Salarias fasciatus TaxID=181472 RepID=A0A672FPA5_SALFA